jgi:hypothetical protein
VPTIFAANESSVLIDGTAVEGVRAVEYRQERARSSVYALGSDERVGMVSGPKVVEGRIRVASTSATLDGIDPNTPFQIAAQLKQGATTMTVTFDECFLLQKSFELGVGQHGEALYAFTATRVREVIG